METKNKNSNRKQRNSNSTAQKMDCGPKYSKVSESLRYITSGSVQCSMFCGGRQCKYEGQAKWSESEMVIKGLYSSWATDDILAMARPSTRTIKKFNVIQQFQRWGINAIINLQHPGEHANCGFGLENSGFTYNPEDFMNSGIFFFNFIWQDYGVRSLESVLDIVKVMDFALQDGKVAVHCHAGLGRTGVLIACYLIYSLRKTPEEAIHIVRKKRPRSVQTRGQISCVQEFAKFLTPLWIIFPSCYILQRKPFTLQKYLVNQKRILHGYEARELKFIPKVIFVTCKRLLELCGLDATKLKLTDKRLVGKPDDELDSTDGEDELENSVNNSNENTNDISASLEDLKGEFDTKDISSNEDCEGFSQGLSNSQTSESVSFENDAPLKESSRQKSDSDLCLKHKADTENGLELLHEDGKANKGGLNNELSEPTEHLNTGNSHEGLHEKNSSISEHMFNVEVTADDVAAAVCGDNEAVDDIIDKVDQLQSDLNDSDEGWQMVEKETNPYVLTTLMVSWIDCLTESVLSKRDVELLVKNKENPQEALLALSKSQRGTCECLLVTIFKLNLIDEGLREKALLRILTILTQNCIGGVRTSDDAGTTSESPEEGDEIVNSCLMSEFLDFCMLLYQNWLNELR